MIKVLIADDHAIVRGGLKQVVADSPDIVVAGEAASGPEALDLVAKNEWDVVVLDIAMPGRGGMEVLRQIKNLKPNLAVLMLTMYPEKQYAVRALKSGAAGYLTKESAPAELIAAIRKVAAGGRYISAALAEKLALDLRIDTGKLPHERLSDREHQVMQMIASGKTPTEIAETLCLSVKTISTYRSRILEKMAIKTSAEMMSYAIKHGLVE
jgi:DNA-binding NarL/FixJ family response regulator